VNALPAGRDILDRVIYWGLMAQIVLLPLAHVATLLWVTFSLTIAAFVLKAFQGGIRFRVTVMDLPFALFVAATLVSTLYSVDRLETLDQVRSDVIIPMANFYLAAWGLRRRSELTGFSRAAVIIIGVLSVYGIVHFFVSGGELGSYLYRESSLSDNYHYLGTYLVVVLPLVLMNAAREANRIWLWTARGVALLAPMAIYITYDRGCWLALGVIGLCLYPLLIRRLKVYLTGLAAAALIVILLIPSGVLVHGKWIGAYKGKAIEANTLSQRLMVWDYCLRCLETNPWTGIGFGRENFKLAFAEFVSHYEKFQLFHCHNTYFDLALQVGVLGLAAFLLMAYAGLHLSFAVWTRAGPVRDWGAAGFLCLVGFMTRIMWDSLYMDEHARVLWLVLGAVLAASHVADQEENTSP
jgi:putative inorganic carbon (HCO3(-)) transporter